jgi:hypothetical protein
MCAKPKAPPPSSAIPIRNREFGAVLAATEVAALGAPDVDDFAADNGVLIGPAGCCALARKGQSNAVKVVKNRRMGVPLVKLTCFERRIRDKSRAAFVRYKRYEFPLALAGRQASRCESFVAVRSGFWKVNGT